MNGLFEILANHAGEDHMSGYHMTELWGFSFMGFLMIFLWFIFIAVAFLVYKDAKKRGMNGVLWFILVVIPWFGIIFLIIYLIIREEETEPYGTLEISARAILDERYALGEITVEEYRRVKKDIAE